MATPAAAGVVFPSLPVAPTIDGAVNSATFISLTSVLDAGVPVAEPGELRFPAEIWRIRDQLR